MKRTINDLFLLAKKDESFLGELTDRLIIYGENIAKITLKRLNIYNIAIEDLQDYILFIVYYIYINYKSESVNFQNYARFVFKKRLTSKIMELINSFAMKSYSLDDVLDDGTPLVETIPANLKSVPDLVDLNDLRLSMSSPKRKLKGQEKLMQMIYTLRCQGYTRNEIMDMLHLTLGRYRYLSRLISSDLKKNELH